MKKIVISFAFILGIIFPSFTQVYTGSDEVEGKIQPGFYLYVKGEEAIIQEIWSHYLEKIGSVRNGRRNTLLSRLVNIPQVPYQDMKMKSKIHYGKNDELKIFVSIEIEEKKYLINGEEGYREATIWLEKFNEQLALELAYLSEQKKLNDLYKEQENILKIRDRLERETKNNLEKILDLEKKLKETKEEAELLIGKTKQNQLDLAEIDSAINEQIKVSESAKKAIP